MVAMKRNIGCALLVAMLPCGFTIFKAENAMREYMNSHGCQRILEHCLLQCEQTGLYCEKTYNAVSLP